MSEFETPAMAELRPKGKEPYWKAEVSTGDPNRYDTNGVMFETAEEATRYAIDLAARWTLVTDYRVRVATAEEAARDSLYTADGRRVEA